MRNQERQTRSAAEEAAQAITELQEFIAQHPDPRELTKALAVKSHIPHPQLSHINKRG